MAATVTIDSNPSPMPSSSQSKDPLVGELDGELTKLASSASSSFKNLSTRQLIQKQWSNMRSWGSFIDTSKMRAPISTIQWSRRLMRNIEFFQSNYICVFFVLFIYCILTSPLLLLAIALCLAACYIITLRNSETPLKIMGYQLSLGQQYLAIAFVSFPLFYLARAGSAVFWVLGASFFFIGLHASIYAIEASDSSGSDALFSDVQSPVITVQSL